jgi:DNA-binding transcriptional MerR regulator
VTTPGRFFSPIETSRRLGVSVAALRLYERRGLLRPQRTGAGWRVYGPDELARLHQVLALRSLGLPLARIAELLAGKEGRLDAVLAVQEEALSHRLAELTRALQSIRRARDRLAADQTLSLDDLATLARETRMIMTMEPEEWRRDFEPIWRKHLSDEGAPWLAATRDRARRARWWRAG